MNGSWTVTVKKETSPTVRASTTNGSSAETSMARPASNSV
jgi:hypothetical protein